MKRSLKVVLLVERINVPEWQYILLQRLLLTRQIRVSWVITIAQEKVIRYSAQEIGLNLLSRIDRFWYEQAGSAHQLRSLSSLQSRRSFRTLEDKTLQQDFRQEGIDILINLQNRTNVPPWAYPLTRLGVWELFFDDDLGNYHRCSGFQAFTRGENKVWCGIKRMVKQGQKEQCIFLSSSCIYAFSFNLSIEPMLWKMATVMPYIIDELQKSDDQLHFLKLKKQQFGVKFRMLQKKAGIRSRFKNPSFQKFLGKCARGKAQSLFNKVFIHKRWVLLYGKKLQLSELQFLLPPKGYFWADPCLISYQNRHFIFFEEWVDAQKKGRIAVLEWYKNGLFSRPHTVLDKPYHLSYPFVFEYQGDFYLIPESAENHSITIYRCTHFPDRWEYVNTLMDDIEAYDVTVHYHAGRWWMFTNIRNHTLSSSDDLLYLFYASSPLSSTWTSHPANPVVTDVATARPAGKIFSVGNRLYRPSQNCAGSYGRGLNMNLIVEWNEHHYKERTVHRYIPDGQANLTGMHTFSAMDQWILSDGIYQRLYWKKEPSTHE